MIELSSSFSLLIAVPIAALVASSPTLARLHVGLHLHAATDSLLMVVVAAGFYTSFSLHVSSPFWFVAHNCRSNDEDATNGKTLSLTPNIFRGTNKFRAVYDRPS